MNVRLAVHLIASTALALALVFTGLALGGPGLALLGFVLWFLVEAVIKALLPHSFHPGVEGAQPTSAVYRGWAAKLVAGTALGRTRTVEGDAARLAAGTRLCTLSFGVRDGSQTLGNLLLQRTPDGTTALAWRGRGKDVGIHPIVPPTPVLHAGRNQQNATQARLGYRTALQFGQDTYWLRDHDAALLKAVLTPAAPGGAGPVAPATA
ncbi:hypothetical protein [Kitasatospora terrestris]|uniref:SMODS-associating 2TM beta-strand rich effector domain-containing protein n=1 Tax=Kitasatospora terrestris TaxID=258051 RepID=A0ABP9EHV2_9ACTN